MGQLRRSGRANQLRDLIGNLHDKAQIVRTVGRAGPSHADYGDGATVEISARILAALSKPFLTARELIETGLRDRRLTGIDDRHLRIAPGEHEITRHVGPDSYNPQGLPASLASCLEREHKIIYDGEQIHWYYR